MRKFYCPAEDIGQDYIYIKDRTEVHHIKNVLRMKINDKIRAFSDNGCEYEGLICRINPQCIGIEIQEAKLSRVNVKKNRALISVACAIPKRAKMDNIVDKLTQLGIYKIFPLGTERTIVRWDTRAKEKHLKRWQKIAINASGQSGRSFLPSIEPVRDLSHFLNSPGFEDYDLKLISTLSERCQNLRDVLSRKDRPYLTSKGRVLSQNKFTPLKIKGKACPSSQATIDKKRFYLNAQGNLRPAHERRLSLTGLRRVLVLIGPEGDFSLREVALAKKAGFIPVSLGNLVLRVDTAAIALASFLKFSLES